MSQAQKILIVDDEELFRLNIRALLEDLGYDVIEAADGRQGLAAVESSLPNLVLSDLRMPEMDGLSLITAMHEKYPEIPVIVISGAGTVRDAIEAVRRGASDYITKPIEDMDGLDLKIKRVLERSQLMTENLRYRENLEKLVREQTEELEAGIAERENLLNLLRAIGEEVSVKTGDSYFKSLVLFLSSQLNMEYAIIGMVVPGQRRLKTIAVSFRGSIVKNIEYNLENTPCDKVMGNMTLFHPKNIQKLFPEDKMLKDMGIESYAGIPIFISSKEKAIGLMAVLGCTSIEDSKKDSIMSLMQIFVGRSSSEIQRLQAQEERKIMEKQLRQAQKMEAVGQLAGGVAHDFNNLLYVISGYTEMMMDDLLPESHLYQNAAQIMKASQRAATLVRQLLLFSRKEAMQVKDIDLNELITNLMKMVRRVIGEHISIEVSTGFNIKNIKGDTGQIEQIIMNLCLNSKDAMTGSGKILIKTETICIDAEFCELHPWAKPGEYALLTISDTGHGIAPELKERIFDPFFTTKEVGKGTGLGLAAVYGIVKSHNGMIHLYSEEGYGTTFKIYLPTESSNISPSNENEQLTSQTGGIETILLAEDEKPLREMLLKILKKAGYRVFAAEDGEKAIQIFNKNSESIDIALLDIVMPKAGGQQIIEHISNIRPELPAIFMTGYSKGLLSPGILSGNRHEIIQKPISRSILLEKVRVVLDAQN